MTKPRTMRVGAPVSTLSLARQQPARMTTPAEQDNEERSRLYKSSQWRHARAAFLAQHPLCAECQRKGRITGARVVDHLDGHQHADWRLRFWNAARWEALCIECHNAKAAIEGASWRRDGGAVRRGGGPKILPSGPCGTAAGASELRADSRDIFSRSRNGK
jgi:5-methylcytosine-specific restriction protein A